MSGTLNLNANLVRDFGTSVPRLPIELPNLEITLNNQELDLAEWIVGTTAENMPIGDVSAANQGYLILVNTDSTNYVTWGIEVSSTYYPLARIRPGHWCVIELEPSVTYQAKANAASVKLYKALLAT